MDKIKRFYEKQYKKLLLFTIVILFLAIGQIGYQIATTGDFVSKGVNLQGGVSVTVTEDMGDISGIDNEMLRNTLLGQFPGNDVDVRDQTIQGAKTGIVIAATVQSDEDVEKFKEVVAQLIPGLTEQEVADTMGSIGSKLSGEFFRQTITAMIIAFVLMGLVVFFYFRVPTPSMAVILAAFSDIIETLAIFNLLGMKLTTAGIAAFLMLIGYSVDTDILLSTRVLKRKEGTIMDRIYGAMKTGFTMSATTLTAIIVAMSLTSSHDLKQIMIILFIGLLLDIPNTWIQNVGLLRMHLEKKHGKTE